MADSVSCLRGTEDVAKVGPDTKTEVPLSPNKGKMFEVFFLMSDDDRSVWVMETPEIDLDEVMGCLKQGDSVFIHCKQNLK